MTILLKFAGVSNHVMRHSNIVVFLPSKRPKFRVRLSLVFCQLFCSYCFSPPFHIFFLMVCFPFNSYCRRFRFFETHSLPRMQCHPPPTPPRCAAKDQWKIKKYKVKMARSLLYRLSQKMHVPRRFSPNQWDDLAFRWEHVRNTFLPQFFCIRTKNRLSSIGFFGKWARLLNRWNGWLLTS